MAKNKRTEAQRALDLVQIERLHLKGMPALEIAEKISSERPYTLSRQQVGYDLKTLEILWRAEAKAEIDAAKAKTLAEIRILQETYWDAWARSCEEKTKTRTEKSAGGTAKASVEKDQMLGNPAFLAGVQWCIEQRCKIFGINAPVKAEITGKDGEALFLPISIVKMPIDEL